ncbi:hypothetical protein Aperf_G00000124058 [Anoplocephala perfoliata]
MSFRQMAITLFLVVLLLHTCRANSTVEEQSVEIKLVAWEIHKFSYYFCIILSLLCITLFKMYYPKIPIIPDYIPQSLLLIVIGVIFGVILDAVPHGDVDTSMWKLNPKMFFYYLLPPIVLDAAFSLYNRTFFDYLGSILIYAVLGTVLNFLIIGPLMYGLDKAGAMGHGSMEVSLNAYFLFSSLIVAVDPVAVLAIFQDIGVEPGLYYMVFGESLLNDAVTVVLYKIMNQFVGVSQVHGYQIGLGFASFFTISLGGLVVGVAIGLISSVFTRWTSHFGCFFTLTTAYFSYILGDCLGWSGIITMIGCGLVQADYAFHNISPNALTSVHVIIKEIAEISEAFIFFLIGVQLLSAEIEWDTGFCLWGMIACLIARSVVTLVLTYIINSINVNDLKVTFKQQAILIYGGLRGAVALSLALLIEDESLGRLYGKEIRKYIVTATLFIILFTVGFMGLTMKPLVKMFHIKLAGKEELSIFGDLNGNILDHVLAGIEAIVGSNGRNSARAFFTRIDDDYVRRVLQRNPEKHDERIVRTYENIALKLHYATIKPSKSSAYLEGLPETIRQKHLQESGGSSFRLPALTASVSDPRLLEFFATGQTLDSATSMNDQSYESLNKAQNPKDTAYLDHESDYVMPDWRRKSSARNEEFEEEFLDVLRSKAKASRFLRLRRNRSKARLENVEELSEAERRVEEQTAANTALNQAATQPDRVNTVPSRMGDSNVYLAHPPKDYPSDPAMHSSPKFQIGDDD